MASFIEDLYFGTMQKQEHHIRNSDCAPEEIQSIIREEKYVLDNLPEECRSHFMEYLDAWGIVSDEFAFQGFKAGFRLGAKCILDTFPSDIDEPTYDFLNR